MVYMVLPEVVLYSRLRFSLARRRVTSGHVSQHESLSHSGYKGCMWLMRHFRVNERDVERSWTSDEDLEEEGNRDLRLREETIVCYHLDHMVKEHIYIWSQVLAFDQVCAPC